MKVFLFLLLAFLFSCSSKVLLPYEEEPLCKKGIGEGRCGRLSDIYEDTLRNPEDYGIDWRSKKR